MTTTPQLTAQQLAFYIGQRCVAIYMPENEIASTFEITARVIALREDGVPDGAGVVWKPILRRLESLTFEEKQDMDLRMFADRNNSERGYMKIQDSFRYWEAFRTQFLLGLGIDLFGWIDADLAIDKATTDQK